MGKENKNKTKFREWLTKKEPEGGAGFTQPDKNKDIFYKEDMCVYFLNGSFRDNSGPKINAYSDNDNETKLFEEYKATYESEECKNKFFFLSFLGSGFNDLSDKYVLSVEPFDGKDAVNTSTTSLRTVGCTTNRLNEMLENGLKSDKSCVCIDGQCYDKSKKPVGKKYWLRFIKIVDINGNTTYDIVKHYLELSDSRTYKDTVYYPVYKSVLSSPDESNDERLPHNLLVYGAPGTGKSHYINTKFEERFLKQLDNYKPFDVFANKQLTEEDFKKMSDKYKEEFGEEMSFKSDDNSSPNNQIYKAQNDFRNKYLTRVTFYEDYSYENFVGCYKPVEDEDGKITYKFEAGPFIDIYIKAKKDSKKDSKHNYLLAIEEINRANAAAVFGDLFQVLDRDDNGNSEYSVKPEAALNKYLEKNLVGYDGTISLPANLYIWATMNSADQGVHVLDSAFKRRWQFLYMDINNSESAPVDDKRKIVLPVKNNDGNIEVKTYTWDGFRTAVNKVLEDNKIEEDRWVGAWFFKQGELDLIKEFYENKDESKGENKDESKGESKGNTKFKPNPLVDKLLAYLLQDVVKMNKDILFEEKYHNMSSIRKDLSNSTSPKNIFDVLKIDKSTLKEIQETENPTPTDTAVTENG